MLTEQDGQRVHTLYQPGSFVPLLRIEGDTPPVVPTLVQTLEQEAGIHFEPEVADQLHRLEGELRAGTLSAHSQQWLNHAQLKPDQLQALLKAAPERVAQRVHLYHCDHLGTPIALINQQGEVDWQAEFDAWGNQVAGRNPQRLYQPIRMQGQHYDEETGLHYNRHRYYDPMLGRYINQDPIGLEGGMNVYQYPLDPMVNVDPLGLTAIPLPPPLPIPGVPNPSLDAQKILAQRLTDLFDNAGRKVSPDAQTMEPPGNCTPGEKEKLQDQVKKSCKTESFSCKKGMDAEDLYWNRERGRQCAMSRDKINNKCFAGGDQGHRNAAMQAWNSVVKCEKIMGGH